MELKDKISKLYFYWVNAEDMFYLIKTNFKIEAKAFPDGFKETVELHSSFQRLLIAYSLLYVVIEAFKDLKLNDETLEKQIHKGGFIDDFRRLRNATFHYQADFRPEKIYDFILAEGSDKWAQETHKAFENYFLSFNYLNKYFEFLKDNLNEK